MSEALKQAAQQLLAHVEDKGEGRRSTCLPFDVEALRAALSQPEPQAGEVTDELVETCDAHVKKVYGLSLGRLRDKLFASAILALRPQAESSEWQPVTEDDLTAFEKFITERSQNAPFIPADANTLANATMHMIREVRAARALRPAAQPMTDQWRLLNSGDRIQAGDECLQDDCVTWLPLAGWEVGMTYNAHILVPMRRRVEAHHGITAQGGDGQ